MIPIFATSVVNGTIEIVDELYCKPDRSANFSATCDYVRDTGACAGGGYLEWTTLVFCCEDQVAKWFIVAGAVLLLLLLIFVLSISADEFFSPNVASIVAHLGMSENVAGVTFMAFGNGVSDVLTSVASVLSSPQPKADLALGELIGGTIFITLNVTAAIVITRPFKAAFWPTLRDLIFLLITASFILSMFVFYDEIELWQPLCFLGLYVTYVAIVFITEYFKKRRRSKIKEESKQSSAAPSRSHTIVDASANELVPSTRASQRGAGALKRLSIAVSTVLSVGYDDDADDVVVVHNHVYQGEELKSRRGTIHQIDEQPHGIWPQLLPVLILTIDEENPSRYTRIKTYFSWPFVVLFRLTTPLTEWGWTKPLAIIHAVIAPQFFLLNTHMFFTAPIPGGPGLWAYVPIISIALILLIVFATSMDEEPRFYTISYSLAGFIASIGWIYCILAEVVNVVDMLGVLSGIDQAVLGITIIAWANSVGDLVADISVARQGYPRMALAASIGGPVFNLLIGFGLPFTFAKLRGDTVPITLDGVNIVMITFLFASIIISTLNLLVFRANLKRIYGISLVVIYAAFLVFIILSETGILVWM